MMRLLVCAGAFSFVLTGCFLNQTPPAPQDGPLTPGFEGIVALDDTSGWGEPSAELWAGFWKKETSARFQRSARLSRQAVKRSPPECALKTMALPLPPGAAKELVNVGKISFGPALQSSLTDAEPNSINYYQKSVTPGLPAGLYQVVAKGSREVKAFGDFVSLPEALQDASVNGVVMEEGIPLLHKAAILVKWKKPAVEHDMNFILLDFKAESETHRYHIGCVAQESDLAGQEAFAHWTLPQSMVDEIPVTMAAAFYLTRAHVRGAANQQIAVQFQGMKTKATPAVVLEQ